MWISSFLRKSTKKKFEWNPLPEIDDIEQIDVAKAALSFKSQNVD